jgi:hypothetical protein
VISAWWLLVAFLVGGYAGALLIGLMAIGRGDDTESAGARGESRRFGARLGPNPDPAVDWLI